LRVLVNKLGKRDLVAFTLRMFRFNGHRARTADGFRFKAGILGVKIATVWYMRDPSLVITPTASILR